MRIEEVEVISFDVDGTLVDGRFMDEFWNKHIPFYYSKKHGLSIDESIEIIKRSYDEVGDRDVRWYIPDYWFKRFNLDINLPDALKEFKDGLRIYPDAIEVLEELKGRTKLIAVTNAVREIMEFELRQIKKFFWKTFSCPSDFGDIRCEPGIYLKICNEAGAKPEKVLHIGDHPYFDFEVPRKAGIRALLIDRDGKNGHIRKLTELKEILRI
jgi:putative hydrolase of the HAD superfamily